MNTLVWFRISINGTITKPPNTMEITTKKGQSTSISTSLLAFNTLQLYMHSCVTSSQSCLALRHWTHVVIVKDMYSHLVYSNAKHNKSVKNLALFVIESVIDSSESVAQICVLPRCLTKGFRLNITLF